MRQFPSCATHKHFLPFLGSLTTRHRHIRKLCHFEWSVIRQAFIPGPLENRTGGKVDVEPNKKHSERNLVLAAHPGACHFISLSLSFLICDMKGPTEPPQIAHEFSRSPRLLWSCHLGLTLLCAPSGLPYPAPIHFISPQCNS